MKALREFHKRAYIMMKQNDKAIKTYEALNKDYPHSPLSRQGRL